MRTNSKGGCHYMTEFGAQSDLLPQRLRGVEGVEDTLFL